MSNFSNPPNERGLVMPRGLGDETDDMNNWRAFDQMLQGTHPDQNIPAFPFNAAALAALQGIPAVDRETLIVLGQSNEVGSVPNSPYYATHPGAFESQFVSGVTSRSCNGGFGWWPGSPWPSFFDSMLQHGYWFDVLNHAVGGLSFVDDMCGRVKTWAANSTAFCQTRTTPINPWDRGYLGDIIVESGRVFRCTTGTQKHIHYGRPQFNARAVWGEPVAYVSTSSPLATGGSKPAGFASATLGQTVADGAVTWTCIDDANQFGMSTGMIFNQDLGGYGFDPFGILRAMDNEVCRRSHPRRPWVLLCNGQSDTSNAGAPYRTALTAIANWLLPRGYRVAIGLSSFTSGGSAVTWDALTADVNAVLASFAANPNVKAGANLYAALGTSPSLQGDGVHLDGAGVIAAGAAHANAFKVFMPER